MKKIGVYGGSFDPIHTAHIELAKQALEELQLEKVIFVPAKFQPFKLGKETASEENRKNMLQLALEGNTQMLISLEEFNNNEISYTFKTLRKIKQQYEGCEIFFILGTDSFISIEKWYMSQELLENYCFAVGIRPNYKEQKLLSTVKKIKENYGTSIVLLKNTQHNISSTDIKNKLKNKESIRGLVPESVERYIYEHNLYI